MKGFLKHTTAIFLSALLLGRVFLSISGNCIELRSQLFSDLITSIEQIIFEQGIEKQNLPINGSGDLDSDSEEVEEEKENLYIRYSDDPFELHFTSINNKSLIFNDTLITSDPLDVIVPPPDLIV